MDESITFKKSVVNDNDFNKVVDVNFRTFTANTSSVTELTVGEFFSEYSRLYYTIPINGEINSHEYLVRRSSELLNLEQDTTDIQPLLDEIATLRTQLLQANSSILELQTRSNG